jgi:hypothetical protein
LITHNGDEAVDDELATNIDHRVLAWFAQNVNTRHSKVRPIPIGLENMSYYNNGLVRVIENARRSLRTDTKKNRISWGFTVNTNPGEREAALLELAGHPLAEKVPGWPVPPTYFDLLSKYAFVASPPGNGIDCHRTWEAMLLRTVPIVKRSIATEFFRDLGLPMMLLNDWSDLRTLNETDLRLEYQRLTPGFDSPYLQFDAWWDMIKSASRVG